MTQVTLAAASIAAVFPAGTLDTEWTFTVTGTNADGTAFSQTASALSNSTAIDLPAGTFTLVVSKNGVSSLPSDAFDLTVPATVTLQVPDATQKATITAA